jgi:hypothetical protein
LVDAFRAQGSRNPENAARDVISDQLYTALRTNRTNRTIGDATLTRIAGDLARGVAREVANGAGFGQSYPAIALPPIPTPATPAQAAPVAVQVAPPQTPPSQSSRIAAIADRIREATRDKFDCADALAGIGGLLLLVASPPLGVAGLTAGAGRVAGAIQPSEAKDLVASAASLSDADRRILALALQLELRTGIVNCVDQGPGDPHQASEARSVLNAFCTAALDRKPSADEQATAAAIARSDIALLRTLHSFKQLSAGDPIDLQISDVNALNAALAAKDLPLEIRATVISYLTSQIGAWPSNYERSRALTALHSLLAPRAG